MRCVLENQSQMLVQPSPELQRDRRTHGVPARREIYNQLSQLLVTQLRDADVRNKYKRRRASGRAGREILESFSLRKSNFLRFPDRLSIAFCEFRARKQVGDSPALR